MWSWIKYDVLILCLLQANNMNNDSHAPFVLIFLLLFLASFHLCLFVLFAWIFLTFYTFLFVFISLRIISFRSVLVFLYSIYSYNFFMYSTFCRFFFYFLFLFLFFYIILLFLFSLFFLFSRCHYSASHSSSLKFKHYFTPTSIKSPISAAPF